MPQEYSNIVASANMGYSNKNAPNSADAPNGLISFYGSDGDSTAPSRPAKSHDGYCRDSLSNKLCCDDGVGTVQNQEELRTNCQICMLPPNLLCMYSSIIGADLMLL